MMANIAAANVIRDSSATFAPVGVTVPVFPIET